MDKVRVWLNARMVDFGQPVEVRLNAAAGGRKSVTFRDRLQPRLDVLLEDYYRRGDAKNLFVSWVDFDLTK